MNSLAITPTHTINILLHNRTDQRLLAEYLRELGYGVSSELPDSAAQDGAQPWSLVLVDAPYADRYRRPLLDARKQATSFLPILILLPQKADSTLWLQEGFDDVLRLPISKAELAARLNVFLRLREQSEARFRAVFEQAPIGIYRSTPAGRLLVANPAIVELFGYESLEAMMQVNLGEVAPMHEYQRDQLREQLDSQGEVVGFETPVRRRDGSTIFIRENARTIFDAEGKPLFYEGTIENITERKRAEQAILAHEQLLQGVLASLAAHLCVIDSSGTIIVINESWKRFARENDALSTSAVGIGANYLQVCERAAQQGVEGASDILHGIQQVMAGEITQYVSKYPAHSPTEQRWFLMMVTPLVGRVGAVITHRNISEQVLAEQALQQREEHFRALIENSSDAIALLDLEGRILYASNSSTRVLGYDMEEMIGENVLSIVHPDDLSYTIEQAAKAVQNSSMLIQFEHRLRHKDGTWRWIEATDRNLLHNPAIGAIVANFRDITERKEAEQEKTRLLGELSERVKELRLLRDASDLLYGREYPLEDTLARLVQLIPHGWKHSDSAVARLRVDGTTYTSESFRESPWAQRAMFSTSRHEEVSVEVAYLEQHWAEGESPFSGEEWALLNSLVQMLHTFLERRYAEEQLRFQGYLLNQVGQAVVATALDGTIRYWNKAAELLYGWPAQEAIGQNILSVTPSEATREQAKEIMQALQAGESWSGEFEVQRRDGSSFPALVTDSPLYDEQGNLVGIVGISANISERKRAEEQLRFQAQLLDSVREAIFATDLDGTIVYWGKGAARLYGHAAAEALGQPYTVFMGEEEATSGRARLREARRHEHWQGQHRYQQRDGTVIWLDTLLSLVRDEAKQPRGIIGIDRDITQRKQRERELEAIAQVSQGMRTATTPGEMMPLLLHQVATLLETSGAALAMLESTSGDLVIRESHGTALGETGQRIPRGAGHSTEILQTQRPFLSANMLHEKNLIWQPKIGPAVAAIGAPLIARDRVLGVLWLNRVRPFSEEESTLILSICDVAANALYRAELYESSLKHLQRVTALHEIDRAITGSFDLRVVLNVFLEQVLSQLGVDAADILLLDPHTLLLEQAASLGFRSSTSNNIPLRLGAGQAGEVALQRRTREIPNIAHLGKAWRRQRLLHEEKFVYAYLVPLIAKGEVQGVLELFHRSPLVPEEEWKDFTNTLATQSAIAIENATLFTDLQRSNTQLIQAYDATIEGWSRALDLRDEETEGHSMRVTQLTLRLAREMGITQKETVHIRRGALLHDIGKMGIPDSILLKPGKLSDEEWEIMKTHPVLAYEMLAPIQFLRSALDIPYSHHERWDGTGYPRGLKGEQIPQAARLFSVVDVYDALTSNRPYRTAWSSEKTIDYLKEQAGKQFDPRVVDAFLRIMVEDSHAKPLHTP